LFNDIYDKSCEVIFRQIILDTGWEKIGSVSVYSDELSGQWLARLLLAYRVLFYRVLPLKSDRLLA
jgi:hypothetical protein